MNNVQLRDISLPCWIYDLDLVSELASNRAATVCGDVYAYIVEERKHIKEKLTKDGLTFFGSNKKFIAYTVKDKVIVQCLADLAIHTADRNELDDIELERANHKDTQEKLRQHSAKLNAIFDSTALYIWTLRGDGMLTSCNKRFKEQMWDWFEREMIVGEDLVRDPYEENIEEWVHFQKIVSQSLEGKKSRIQLRLKTHSENYVWVEVNLDPIIQEDGEINEVSCIGFEISEQKKKTELINKSLKEKDTLLREVHHRVKNNLQIVSSLLNLQSAVVKDEQVSDILKESQNRIQSMSYIHESLYINNDFSAVNLRDYIQGLCSNLVQSYSLIGNNVDIVTVVDDISLELDQAIPCGLILNELLSNCFKHAYPNGEKGRLRIELREKDGRMAILVEDDGKGIPEDWDVETAESLGIQLVYTLTEQLDGDIELSNERGTKYLITFDRIKTSRKWQEPMS